jgi:hypothetical protein
VNAGADMTTAKVSRLQEIRSDGAAAGAFARPAAAPLTGDGHTAESACLNCGTPLAGRFCHQCGQHAHVHRTLGAFGHDLLHGVLHLEGKVWHTLPKLLFRPGELTRRYIAGERARFVSPLAMFLFSVFLMFAAVSFLGSPASIMDAKGNDVANGIEERTAELDRELTALRQTRAAAVAAKRDTAAIDARIADREEERAFIAGLTAMDQAADGDTPTTARTGLEVDVPADPANGDPTRKVTLGRSTVLGFQPDSAFDRAYQTAKQNPSLLIYKLQTNAYKYSWALIILSVPFLALLFLWRWRPLYDHTVFVTYSITAVSILTTIGSLLVLAGVSSGAVFLAATLFIPWHMYRQLRGGYGLRRFSALWRTLFLLLFAALALILFTIGLVTLGVLG